MAKKETINNYPKEDLEKLLKLFQHTGPLYQEQQDFIYYALRKYISPTHWKPIAGCNCQFSYAVAFNILRDWTSKNSHLFL